MIQDDEAIDLGTPEKLEGSEVFTTAEESKKICKITATKIIFTIFVLLAIIGLTITIILIIVNELYKK